MRVNFIRNGVYHLAYEKKTIIYLEIYYSREHQKGAQEIWNYIVSKFPDNPF